MCSSDLHAQSRARKRMPVHHLRGESQLQAQLADLVLEQFAQWLQQLQLHVLRQAAHIVVRLDHVRLAGPCAPFPLGYSERFLISRVN